MAQTEIIVYVVNSVICLHYVVLFCYSACLKFK